MPERDDTGQRRRTEEVEILDHRVRVLEKRDAEMHGFDGDGGRFATLEATVRAQGVDVADLKQLKWKLLGMVTLGGVVAGLAAWAIGMLGKL